jgi:hypothetical protein
MFGIPLSLSLLLMVQGGRIGSQEVAFLNTAPSAYMGPQRSIEKQALVCILIHIQVPFLELLLWPSIGSPM